MDEDLELERLGSGFGGSESAQARKWLERLPELVRSVRAEWGLRLGRPYAGGSGAWVAPAECPRVLSEHVHTLMDLAGL